MINDKKTSDYSLSAAISLVGSLASDFFFPPSLNTFYISVSKLGCMLSELRVHRRIETLERE